MRRIRAQMNRFIAMGILAALSTSCHSSPTKPLGDPILQFSRQPADGFCPQDGTLFKATVYKNTSGTHTIVASMLVGYDSRHDSCVVTIGRCLVETPLGQRVLTSTQASQLQALLAVIPAETPPINFACDPCQITRFEFGGRIADNNPCFENSAAADAYQQSLIAAEDFLSALVLPVK